LFVTSADHLMVRTAMRWYSVTRVTSVYIKRAMEYRTFLKATGCVEHALSTFDQRVFCVLRLEEL